MSVRSGSGGEDKKLCALTTAVWNGHAEPVEIRREKGSARAGSRGDLFNHFVVINVPLCRNTHNSLATGNVNPLPFRVVPHIVRIAHDG